MNYDIVVIGAGVTGCAVARVLSGYEAIPRLCMPDLMRRTDL